MNSATAETKLNPSSALHSDHLQSAAQSVSQVADALMSLADAPLGQSFIVQRVVADGMVPEWQQQLEDLGFISGEPVSLMARGAFGGDPLVVRIGLSTFALRKAEASCVILEAGPISQLLKAAA